MRILITAGPTREYLDSIRFLSNPSSGRMGFALARAAARRGHDVILVCGPVSLRPPPGVRTVRVTTAAEMLSAARRAFRRCDAAIFAAAVCDYRPLRRAARKLPKQTGAFALRLAPTVDIAAALGRAKGRRVCMGFALEDHDPRAHARQKLIRKNLDAIVLNHPVTVGSEAAKVDVLELRRDGRLRDWQSWPRLSKERVAERLIRFIEDSSRSAQRASFPRMRESSRLVRAIPR
jgi:phosphopantothenoylcysteine decarboxylase/phosphopantothenate--cysteine ligase